MATIPRAPTFSPNPVPPSAPWLAPSANFKLLNSIKPVGVQNFSATQVPIVDPWKVPPNLVATTLFSLFTYPLAERGAWRWPPTYQVTVNPWKTPPLNFPLLNSIKPVGQQQVYNPTAILPNTPWTPLPNVAIRPAGAFPVGAQIFSTTQQITTQPWSVPGNSLISTLISIFPVGEAVWSPTVPILIIPWQPLGNILASTLISTFPVGEQNFSTTQQVSVQPWSVPGNSLTSTLSTFPVGQQVWSQTAQVSVVPWFPLNLLLSSLAPPVFPVGEQSFSQTREQTVQPWIAPPNTLQTTLSLILVPSSPLWLSDEYIPQGPPPGWVQSSPLALIGGPVAMPPGEQTPWLPTQVPYQNPGWASSALIDLISTFPTGKQTPWLPTYITPPMPNVAWAQPSNFGLLTASITFPAGKQTPWLPTQLPPPSKSYMQSTGTMFIPATVSVDLHDHPFFVTFGKFLTR